MAEDKGSVRTDVDTFIDLIKVKKRISLDEAAKVLKVPMATIQAWTDFLVEEKIVGIEYKFTSAYVFMDEQADSQFDVTYIGFDTKEMFYDKARKRGISGNHIRLLWLRYLNTNKAAMKKAFIDRAVEKGVPKLKVEPLWEKYLKYLEGSNQDLIEER